MLTHTNEVLVCNTWDISCFSCSWFKYKRLYLYLKMTPSVTCNILRCSPGMVLCSSSGEHKETCWHFMPKRRGRLGHHIKKNVFLSSFEFDEQKFTKLYLRWIKWKNRRWKVGELRIWQTQELKILPIWYISDTHYIQCCGFLCRSRK